MATYHCQGAMDALDVELIIEAESAEAAAREYVDWVNPQEISETEWWDVEVWPEGEDHDAADLFTVTIHPERPCVDGHEHEWDYISTYGHGGGVIITEKCRHCGRILEIDTWAQRPDTGEQGLTLYRYIEDECYVTDKQLNEPCETKYRITFKNENAEHTIAELGENALENTRKTLEALLNEDPKSIYDYGLEFCPVENEDGEIKYYRYLISYGGPSKEVRFYPHRTEFVFLGWFSGIGFDVSGDKVFHQLRSFLYDSGLLDFKAGV